VEAPTRPRKRRRANPDATLATVVVVIRDEVERLQTKQAMQVCCPKCDLPAGLDERERIWLSQGLRDLTKLALGARKQILEQKLRNLSQGGLDALDDASSRATGMPE
jgi:hypothetical protein